MRIFGCCNPESVRINFSEKLSIRYNFQIIENMIDNSDTFSIVLDFNQFENQLREIRQNLKFLKAGHF